MRRDIFKEGGTYLETGKDKIDKEKFEIRDYIGDLSDCYEEWSGEEAGEGIQDPYQIATELLKKYKIPSLSEDGINEFIEGVEEKEYVYKGIFLSAIINELYKEVEIHLNSDEVDFLGCYNQDKEIVIEGNSGHGTGEDMTGGEIVVEGNCGIGTGTGMKGGEIVIEGDCRDGTGENMKGGEIVIEGNCKEWTGEHMESGKIIIKGNCDYETGKNMKGGEILVEGDCGNYTGEDMKGGKIVIEGNCGIGTGSNMKGGEIVVEGDCGWRTGVYMNGGEIVVKGDCGVGTGEDMTGGKIKIYGDNFDPRKQISDDAIKGEIYHKDELVWKDGELI